MASRFGSCPRANLRTPLLPTIPCNKHAFFSTPLPSPKPTRSAKRLLKSRRGSQIRASNGSSYLEMWKDAMERERKAMEFQKIAENSGRTDHPGYEERREALELKADQFQKLLEVPKEERDRVQRMQVIDRAAAAIAAARALLQENPPPTKSTSIHSDSSGNTNFSKTESNGAAGGQGAGTESGNIFVPSYGTSQHGTPGPDFWSWTPPQNNNGDPEDNNLLKARKLTPYPNPTNSVMEKERSADFLSIPFEENISEVNHNPPLPPLQSLLEIEKMGASSRIEVPSLGEEHGHVQLSSTFAAEAADALDKASEESSDGVSLDGSRWWKDTGIEQRPDGVVCRWTVNRGVSANGSVEWEEKFWEASGQCDYKELGAEKSGRDAAGNVWREFWKESMWQDISSGLVNMERTADKWGKNGKGDEWHEKWWENYDSSGQAEKWAHKWCCIDPNTFLEAGHAHVWHERWGERYDGQGGSMKYTDKWAERCEADGWTKWGDKWDENFDPNGHGVKQGETWWEGKYGERWNRTWGEGHNGSGWVHKYGKSSSGEHWDTHVKEDTWYERYPHYGFEHCFNNSVQLREVRKPPETS